MSVRYLKTFFRETKKVDHDESGALKVVCVHRKEPGGLALLVERDHGASNNFLAVGVVVCVLCERRILTVVKNEAVQG